MSGPEMERGAEWRLTSSADGDELRRLEEGMWHPDTRCDERWLDQHLHADFAEVGRSGRRYVRADFFPIPAARFTALLPLLRFEAREIAPGCMLTTYDSHVTYPRTEVVESAHRSSIWVGAAGQWQLLYHQGTPFEPT